MRFLILPLHLNPLTHLLHQSPPFISTWPESSFGPLRNCTLLNGKSTNTFPQPYTYTDPILTGHPNLLSLLFSKLNFSLFTSLITSFSLTTHLTPISHYVASNSPDSRHYLQFFPIWIVLFTLLLIALNCFVKPFFTRNPLYYPQINCSSFTVSQSLAVAFTTTHSFVSSAILIYTTINIFTLCKLYKQMFLYNHTFIFALAHFVFFLFGLPISFPTNYPYCFLPRFLYFFSLTFSQSAPSFSNSPCLSIPGHRPPFVFSTLIYLVLKKSSPSWHSGVVV